MKTIPLLLFGIAAAVIALGMNQRERALESWTQVPAIERQIQDAERAAKASARKREALMRPSGGPSVGEDLSAKQVLSGVDALRAILTAFPRQRIPELELLDDEDWILVAAKLPVDPKQDQLRDALKDLQRKAKDLFVKKGAEALRAYLAQSDGKLPAQTTDLAPYFEPNISPEILARYEMIRQGTDSNWQLGGSKESVSAKASAVDGEWDETLVRFSPHGTSTRPLHPPPFPIARKGG